MNSLTRRSRIRRRGDVVAGEVDEHDVFGAFLGIGKEFPGEGFVFLGGLASPAGAGDGADADAALDGLHVDLGGAADEGELVAELEAEHVGRGIHVPEGTVKVDGATGVFVLEALGGDDLEDSPARMYSFAFRTMPSYSSRVVLLRTGTRGRLGHEGEGHGGPGRRRPR